MAIVKVVGAPGTGKSFYLSRQIERAIEKYDPYEIVVISYTNAAVEEISSRIEKNLGVKLPYVKTLHSICYRLLGLNDDKFAEQSKYIKQFNEEYPSFAFDINNSLSEDNDENEKSDINKNNKLFTKMNIYRNRLIPVELWDYETKSFYVAWKRFLEENYLVDYAGMIENTIMRNLSIDSMKVLFVDEAQDMTALQMRLLQSWYSQCDSVVMSGDSNQAIFKFAGATPDVFMNMDYDKRVVLDKSYRLPSNILDYSNTILDKSHVKEMVKFNPRVDGGDVILDCDNDLSDNLKMNGTHMILTRCQYQAREWVNYLVENNVPFYNPYRPSELSWNPFDQEIAKAIKIYLKISATCISIDEIKQLVKFCIAGKCFSKRGTKSKIMSMPDGDTRMYYPKDLKNLGFNPDFIDMEGDLVQYFNFGKGKSVSLLKHKLKTNPFDIERKPKVIVGTIHSVKGGEADHVWIDSRLSSNIRKAILYEDAMDDEIRVAYVAVTRARESVGIIGHNDIY